MLLFTCVREWFSVGDGGECDSEVQRGSEISTGWCVKEELMRV